MAKQGLTEHSVRGERGLLPFQRKRRTAAGTEFRLLSRLQTSLDPEQVLACYFEELRQWLDLCGMEWEDADRRLTLGRAARHRHQYRLTLGAGYLGELTVMRRQPLSEAECLILEQSTGLLAYPLRNALLYQQAQAAVRRDPLTGLGNRTALEQSLQRELELAHRHQTPFSLILLDVDNFKHINDRFGHLAGDEVLKGVARVMECCARTSDLLFRYAGDEFVIAMSHTAVDGAMVVANRVRRQVAATSFGGGEAGLSVRVSVGVAGATPGESRAALFHRADEALLQAKRAGRDRVGQAA